MAIGAYSGVDTLAQSATTASEVARKEKEMLQAVQSQKKKMGKEFEAELKDAQERAKRKAKKRNNLFNALQKSSSASLLSGLMGGVGGYFGGKALGGEGFKTGIFEGLKDASTFGGKMKLVGSNLKDALNPEMVAERAEGMMPGADSKLGNIMGLFQSAQNIKNLSSGNVDLIKVIKNLVDKNEEDDTRDDSTTFTNSYNRQY